MRCGAEKLRQMSASFRKTYLPTAKVCLSVDQWMHNVADPYLRCRIC